MSASSCLTVAKGGVGESGATSLITHTVRATHNKMAVVRVVGSDLCTNTGAVGTLCVDGSPVASERLNAPNDIIQAEVRDGDQLAVVVHTIPLFNGIACARLGELSFELQICELERTVAVASSIARTSGPATRDWFAWNNLMPPLPDVFHLVGEVEVPNPGVDVLLVPRVPQGVNPRILLLDLLTMQFPGHWPQIVVWKQASYDKVNVTYDQVQIFAGSSVIANVPVTNVH